MINSLDEKSELLLRYLPQHNCSLIKGAKSNTVKISEDKALEMRTFAMSD